MNPSRIALAALLIASLGAVAPAANAAEAVTLALNWVPGADHAPYYYAKKMGWYAAAGLEVDIAAGRGSAASAQKVGAGADQFGVADLPVVLAARGKGADLVAVMDIYANSAQGFYWLKSSGINGVKDLAGKRIGNPPGDAARVLWPALAKANGIDPNAVTWVNIDANAKLAALKAHTIDATTSFYDLHYIFAPALGKDMGFLAWRDAGLNPYGNVVVANGAWLAQHRDQAAAFVKVTQKAFFACVKDAAPCIHALVDVNSGLTFDSEMTHWKMVEVLMSDPTSQTVALGWFDDRRMADDYKLVAETIGIDKPYDVGAAYTDQFLDKSLKMIKVTPPSFE
jgi:NitT/TauT family transport system substrate-binding protein